jgi:hypothetical protein
MLVFRLDLDDRVLIMVRNIIPIGDIGLKRHVMDTVDLLVSSIMVMSGENDKDSAAFF